MFEALRNDRMTLTLLYGNPWRDPSLAVTMMVETLIVKVGSVFIYRGDVRKKKQTNHKTNHDFSLPRIIF